MRGAIVTPAGLNVADGEAVGRSGGGGGPEDRYLAPLHRCRPGRGSARTSGALHESPSVAADRRGMVIFLAHEGFELIVDTADDVRDLARTPARSGSRSGLGLSVGVCPDGAAVPL